MGKGEEMQDHYWVLEGKIGDKPWQLLSIHQSRSRARVCSLTVTKGWQTRVRKFVAAQ
jgi:hypothetical protein